MYNFRRKMHKCKQDLKRWHKTNFGYIATELKELNSLLMKKFGYKKPNKTKCDELLKRQEIMWCQKSRVNWFAHC